ncbi:acid sphingomyelinase protein [Rutstroemia sp. NJR-2017a WRK4]|nr:acid sphingomyelinase protein [Rutstroemia sp. NJR-2017a WRK4]
MRFSILYLVSAAFVTASLAAVLSKDDLGSTIWAAIEAATTCAACDAVLLLLKGIAQLGDTAFVTTLTEICNLSGVDDPDVCAGAIGLEGPIIAKDLRDMSIQSHTSELFCIRFFGLCSYPAVTPYTVPFPSPKPSTQRPAVSGKTPLKIVHYSDIHVDPFYQTGANYNCTKPICCRAYTSADAAGNTQFPAGQYGNSECDAPVSLEQSMYAAIQSITPDAIASIFTGDIVDHAVWLTNETQNIKDINDAYSRMSGLKQVFGTAGNHESSPANAFPPTARNVKDQQWVYDTLSADWSSFIGASAQTADSFGAYSSLVSGQNLRIISINTNLYFTENYWMYEKTMETDPSGQLAWLVQELQSAETAGERVYIIGHGPPGQSDIFHDGSNYLNQIYNRYSATIAALFFGHTHVDQFEIGYSSYSAQTYANALEVSYIAPSLTPTSGYPAFRVYSVDPVTFGVLDFTTYIADMTLTGQQTSAPVWKEYYSAKAAYGPLVTPPLTDPAAELTPAFWHNVTEVLASNATAFAEYYARKSRGFKVGTCTGDCTTAEICQMRAMESQYNCATITPGVHFSKRDEGGVALKRGLGVIEKNVCEGSEMRRILARIVAEDGALEAGLERARARYRKA